MSGRAGFGRRVARLESARVARGLGAEDARELRAAVERVAAERGLDPADVMAEAAAIVERGVVMGARTLPEMAAVLAANNGLDPAKWGADAECHRLDAGAVVEIIRPVRQDGRTGGR